MCAGWRCWPTSHWTSGASSPWQRGLACRRAPWILRPRASRICPHPSPWSAADCRRMSLRPGRARARLSARAGARLDTLMSAEVVHRLVPLPYRHFERTPSGVIAERLRQLDVLRGFFTGQMPVLAIDLLFVVLFLAAAFTLSVPLGIIAAAAIPVLIPASLPTHRAQR